MKNSGVIAHTDKKSVTDPSLLPLASTSICSFLLCFININAGMILMMHITAMIVSNKRFMFIELYCYNFKTVPTHEGNSVLFIKLRFQTNKRMSANHSLIKQMRILINPCTYLA